MRQGSIASAPLRWGLAAGIGRHYGVTSDQSGQTKLRLINRATSGVGGKGLASSDRGG
jgi:hypothetical protein